jgi:transglutaminase-like putative cysteine protease
MRLRVSHRTRYEYDDPVPTSHHEARLCPLDGGGQRRLVHDTRITPEPAVRSDRTDYFGNTTLYFSLQEPHRQLEVVSTSVVEPQPAAAPPHPGPPWEEVRDSLPRGRSPEELRAYELAFDSPLVRATPDLLTYAAPSFPPGRPLVDAVRDLTSRIHQEFTYDKEATDVSTPLAEVLRRRHGVCQDFAHLQIGCLRALGLAARYVSGYLLTRPPPGRPRLQGADASHAWIAVYVPGAGWIPFDPTNDLIPADEHVTVAQGRDFTDVAPLRGVILGGGRHTLTVAVDVEPV